MEIRLKRAGHRGGESNADVRECPVTQFMNLLGGKWKPIVLFHVANGTNRFGALQRAIPTVSKQMLTTQLREMEADGILDREVFPVVPPRVEYSLTPFGESLMPVIDAMREWGELHPAAGRSRSPSTPAR